MTEPTIPFIDSVFHPTDLGETSERAFAHALAIALVRRARFKIFHAGDRVGEAWDAFPPVRRTLERWGLLEEGSPRAAVYRELALDVVKAHADGGDPVRACFDEIEADEPGIVVLGTEGREGLERWLRPSVANRVARRSSTMTLFVPDEGRGFIDPETGHLSLRRIVVPVDETPDPSVAIVAATRAAEALGDPPVEIEVLCVNGEPALKVLPPSDGWQLRRASREGSVIEEILAAAEDADLLVMPTDGRDGVLDVFRGSHTERVVRRATCPVLAVPSS